METLQGYLIDRDDPESTSLKVGPAIYCSPRHRLQTRILNPRFLGQMACCDAASNICQAFAEDLLRQDRKP